MDDTTDHGLSLAGAYLFPDVLSEDSEAAILAYIDQQQWITSLKRRVQHYGYAYDDISSVSGFAKHKAKPAPAIEDELANLRDDVSDFLQEKLDLHVQFNQCIINEYKRDQSIGGHVDHISFGPVVVSVSLGADCEFVFEKVQTGEKQSVWVPRRSLLVLTGESRYKWKHSVPNRIGMNCNGTKVARGAFWRRVSATFRTLE